MWCCGIHPLIGSYSELLSNFPHVLKSMILEGTDLELWHSNFTHRTLPVPGCGTECISLNTGNGNENCFPLQLLRLSWLRVRVAHLFCAILLWSRITSMASCWVLADEWYPSVVFPSQWVKQAPCSCVNVLSWAWMTLSDFLETSLLSAWFLVSMKRW